MCAGIAVRKSMSIRFIVIGEAERIVWSAGAYLTPKVPMQWRKPTTPGAGRMERKPDRYILTINNHGISEEIYQNIRRGKTGYYHSGKWRGRGH